MKQLTTDVDSIVDNLLLLFPLFYRKLIRVMNGKTGSNPINMEYHVLAMLADKGDLAISTIGNRLGIARPNMTSLIDRLIQRGFALRFHSNSDRRVINISITDKGRKLLAKRKNLVKNTMKIQLASLTTEELFTLQHSLDNVKQVISRISPSD